MGNLGPLELTNLFGPSNKVVYFKKLVFQSAVRFLILFVLTDAILLKMHHISKNGERVFEFQYKVVTGQCVTYVALKYNTKGLRFFA